MLDYLLKNALIVTGNGEKPYYAQLGIEGDKIRFPVTKDRTAKEVINCKGLFISPGFIDIHSHSELSLLLNPEASSKLYQGVTTEVVGNCGFSAAPLSGEATAKVKASLKEYGLELKWRSLAEYFAVLKEKQIAPNLLSFVGQGLLRQGIVGDEKRKPSKRELARMKIMLARALEAGAIGMSSGLAYPPSSYADSNELLQLAEILGYYDGIYAVHLRDEGAGLIDSVKEVLEIAQKSGVSLQISHHKVLGKDNKHLINESLSLIKQAKSNGINVHCDIYPYSAAATNLESVLPCWIFGGSREIFLKRLKREKENIISDLNNKQADNYGTEIVFLNGQYQGKSLAEIAENNKQNWAETLVDILLSKESSLDILKFSIAQQVITEVLNSEFSMIASDALAREKNSLLSKSLCHPRTYGAFSKVIASYVKDGRLSLPEAIKKMTYLPAQKLSLKRGLIKDGYLADVLVFDLNEFKDTATYKKPHSYTTGVKYLFINGKLVLKDKKIDKSSLAGRIIKRG